MNLNDANLNDVETHFIDDEDDEYNDFDDDQEESSHFFNGPSQAAQNFNSQCMSSALPTCCKI